MSSLPKVTTIKNVFDNLWINDRKLEKSEIDKLLRLKINSEPLFNLKNRDFILEIIGMINIMGFDDFYLYLKKSEKEPNREMILKNSPVFESSRRRNFLDITKEIRSVQVESHIKCPRCKQFHVDTITKQTRSADEGATDYHKCSDCGFQWKD